MVNQSIPSSNVDGPGVPTDCLKTLTDFQSALSTKGYAPTTVKLYTTAACHLHRWLCQKNRTLDSLTNEDVQEFLNNHLLRCQCPFPSSRDVKTVRAGLHHLLGMIERDRPIIPRSGQAISLESVENELRDFDEYLNETCGFADATKTYRRRYVKEFLAHIYGNKSIDPRTLKPRDLIGYVAARAQGCKPGTTGVISGSLRSYFKYLQLRGVVDSSLLCAVPSPPRWKLADYPRVLTEHQLKCFLKSFNVSSPSGIRDYAMALCMTEMGLRASEVAQLDLTNIDWRKSTLQINAAKSRRIRVLPLPARPGEAIARYLRNGRPVTKQRKVFVRHTAPVGTEINAGTVRGAIRRAYARAGFPSNWTGTHLLRHTAATRMHQKGANLKQLADILGHRSIDTTMVYTKVNVAALKLVALPWPEVRP